MEQDSRLPSARFATDEMAAYAKDTPPGLSEIGCPAYGRALVLAPYSKRARENAKLREVKGDFTTGVMTIRTVALTILGGRLCQYR
jgi:hypothetical protein